MCCWFELWNFINQSEFEIITTNINQSTICNANLASWSRLQLQNICTKCMNDTELTFEKKLRKARLKKFDFEKREQTGATQTCAASNLVTKIPEKLMVLKKPQQENNRRFDWLAGKTKISKFKHKTSWKNQCIRETNTRTRTESNQFIITTMYMINAEKTQWRIDMIHCTQTPAFFDSQITWWSHKIRVQSQQVHSCTSKRKKGAS